MRTTEAFKSVNVDAINDPLSYFSDLTKSSPSTNQITSENSANITSLQIIASQKTSVTR